jgi:hypothetical protein
MAIDLLAGISALTLYVPPFCHQALLFRVGSIATRILNISHGIEASVEGTLTYQVLHCRGQGR